MEQGLAAEWVAGLVWLLIAMVVVAVSSKYVRVPYTVALVIAGLVLALTPADLKIELTPDLVLFILLPVLLFESAYHLEFDELRENLRPIALLAVPGVIVTALSVAALMHYVVGLGWETAFLFGTIVAATDPVSVLAIFRQLSAPKRLSVIIEGESLFNDGTSLVLFRIVLAGVLAQTATSAMETVWQFVVVVMGGLALGAAIGFLVSFVLSRMDDYLTETVVTLVVAYGTYLLAEQLHVSGVIAVVVAALVVGNYGHSVAMSPTTRAAVASSWEFFAFLANSLIFLLIGLDLDIQRLGLYWAPTLLAIVAVLLVRVVVVAVSSGVLRVMRSPLPPSWQLVLVWGGLRGSLSLAMALSIPVVLAGGAPFPDRELIQIMTFGVILFSLLVQGLTVAPLLRRLDLLPSAQAQEELEAISAHKTAAGAAIAQVERLREEGELSPKVAAQMQAAFSAELEGLEEAEDIVLDSDVEAEPERS